MLRLVCVGFFGILLCSLAAEAGTIKSRDFKDGKTRLDLDGEIQPGDVDAVKSAIQTANDHGRMVATIRLNSPGGNLLESVKIADVIRKGKIATASLSGTTCASACFVIFAAGAEKYAHYTAQIGVHGASNEQGEETTQSDAATVTMARVLRELGVSASIIGKMVVTPPADMVWLTPDDLKSIGVMMLGKPSQLQTPPPVSSAPMQITPQVEPSVQASKPVPTWQMIVSGAIEASRRTYGQVNVNRSCQPEIRVCSIAVFYKTKDGKEAMVRTAEDIQGRTIRRDVCYFNDYSDIRECFDWDSGKATKEMKGRNGKWEFVEDK